MRKVAIWALVAFIWLTGFMTAKVFAGTLVTSDGTIEPRTYKASYLVENEVELADIPHTRTEWKDKESKVYESEPLSKIKHWKPGYAVTGVPA